MIRVSSHPRSLPSDSRSALARPGGEPHPVRRALSLATMNYVLRIDPGASNRNVTLDTAEQNKGRWYIIRHVGAANSVVVKDGADTIATLSTGDVGFFVQRYRLVRRWRSV